MILYPGMGIVPLRPFLDTLRCDPCKPITCVSSHTYFDHIGTVQEFHTRLVHPLEAAAMTQASGLHTLFKRNMPERLQQIFLHAGFPPIGEMLIEALAVASYDNPSCRLHGAPTTGC